MNKVFLFALQLGVLAPFWGRENHVTAFNPNGLARILFLVMAAAFLSEKTKPFPAHRKRALFYGERSRSKTEKPL